MAIFDVDTYSKFNNNLNKIKNTSNKSPEYYIRLAMCYYNLADYNNALNCFKHINIHTLFSFTMYFVHTWTWEFFQGGGGYPNFSQRGVKIFLPEGGQGGSKFFWASNGKSKT